MPPFTQRNASLGGIPSPGTTCTKPWNKLFQASGQVIEGIPLFETSKITVLQFQLFDFVQIAHARQTSSKLGLYSLKRDFQFTKSQSQISISNRHKSQITVSVCQLFQHGNYDK